MSRTIKHIYTKAKAVSKHCRNSSGKCSYCVGNRTYKNNKRLVHLSALNEVHQTNHYIG